MAIIKEGTITGTGSAINLNLGFVPSKIELLNITTLTSGTGVFAAQWYSGMPNASAYTITTAATPVHAYATTNGFTPFQTTDANLWVSTNLTITGITAAAQAVVTATNSLAVGDVVSFHGVVGMTQINTLTGIVTAATGANFTVNINSSAFTAYASGGIANVVSSTSATYCVTPTNGLSSQVNDGQIGITLGTGVAGAASDVIRYIAYLDAPFTS